MHKGNASVNWDDLRFVLAVAEAGSVSAAARVLGVNHATVLRRIAAFEAAQGTTVFDRSPTGYVVPPDRLRVIEAARDAAAAMAAVSRSMRGNAGPGGDVVRVTSTDTLCQAILPQVIAALPEPLRGQVDLICTNAHVDLARLGADVSVRPALRLPEDMAGEQAGVLGFAAYAAPGAPATWLGLRGVLGRAAVAEWQERSVDPALVSGGADSFPVLRELAALGRGRAVLPCCLGDPDPRLQRLDGVMPDIAVPIWVACHVDLAQVARLRVLRGRLAEGLRARAGLLAGH